MSFTHATPGTPAALWRAEVARHDLPAVRLDDGVVRVVVLAAHPDDETLGAGGLVSSAHAAGLEVVVVVATRGEGSHPRSPTYDRERLAAARSEELRAAIEVLSPGAEPHLVGWPDGAVRDHEDDLVSYVVDLVGDGRGTLLVAPWRSDGHPDHEAVGRAAATVAARTGARLLEYPVWFWHWGSPDQGPWADGLRLDLDPASLALKTAAVAEHHTQVTALSQHEGDEVLLDAAFLEHFATPYEIYWEQEVDDTALESLHQVARDPWGVDHRFYEQRKRALVAAMLPRASFRRGVELGCSTGALAEDLARRCVELVAIDASATAVAAARDRLARVGARRGRAGPAAGGLPRRHLRPRRAQRGRLLPQPRRARRPGGSHQCRAEHRRDRGALPLAPRRGGVAARRPRRAPAAT